MATLRVVVKQDMFHNYTPNFRAEKEMAAAVYKVTGMTPQELAYRIDGVFASGTNGKKRTSSNDRKRDLKKDIRRIMCEQLCTWSFFSVYCTLKFLAARLLDYEVVNIPWSKVDGTTHHCASLGVRMIGYPLVRIENFNNYSEPKYKSIMAALEAGTCYWARIPESERAVEAPARRQRSDAGVRRGPRANKKAKSNDTVRDDSDPGEHTPSSI